MNTVKYRPGLLLALCFASLMASCAKPAQLSQQPISSPPIRVAAEQPQPTPEAKPIADERMVAAVQQALLQLGYQVGGVDGVLGPATRKAIVAFQRDRNIREDGIVNSALLSLLNGALAQLPKVNSTNVGAGDQLLFRDGSKELVKTSRIVQWDDALRGGIVAIRPTTAGWPPAARAGLDWAISHSLEDSNRAVTSWSSTGVEQRFTIATNSTLSPREASMAGNSAHACRHFELRATDKQYPGLVCRDKNREWYFLGSNIRLAHPARELGSKTQISQSAEISSDDER